jgi:hypothetical protein
VAPHFEAAVPTLLLDWQRWRDVGRGGSVLLCLRLTSDCIRAAFSAADRRSDSSGALRLASTRMWL